MLKDDVINEVVIQMQGELSHEQTVNLKSILITVLYHIDMKQQITDVAIIENDNEMYFNKFKNSLLTEEKSKNTIEQYLRSTKRFFYYIKKNFRDVNCDDVLLYFAHLKRDTTNSASTRDNERKFVKAFFNWLCDNEEIYQNPFRKMKPIRRDEKKKVILSGEEIEQIRDECKNDVRDMAIIDFLLATGVRVSEISALNIDDVNFQTGEVSVYGIKTRKWRTVFLDAKSSKHLSDYLGSRKDNCKALFVSKYGEPTRLQKCTYEAISKKYARLCGIKKKCTIHLYRKTLASRLHESGMEMSEIAMLLGHSVAVLQKYYLMIDEKSLGNSYKRCIG